MGHQKFSLKTYPMFVVEMSNFTNTACHEFIEELSPLLKMIPKEQVSEGEEEVIQRLDGTTTKIKFEDVSAKYDAPRTIELNTDLDEWISVMFSISKQLVAQMEHTFLEMVSKDAEEHGNVFSAAELSVEQVAEALENANLAFDDDGQMVQHFIVPPPIYDNFWEILSTPQIQSIIERKRKEYFAKKGH